MTTNKPDWTDGQKILTDNTQYSCDVCGAKELLSPVNGLLVCDKCKAQGQFEQEASI